MASRLNLGETKNNEYVNDAPNQPPESDPPLQSYQSACKKKKNVIKDQLITQNKKKVSVQFLKFHLWILIHLLALPVPLNIARC